MEKQESSLPGLSEDLREEKIEREPEANPQGNHARDPGGLLNLADENGPEKPDEKPTVSPDRTQEKQPTRNRADTSPALVQANPPASIGMDAFGGSSGEGRPRARRSSTLDLGNVENLALALTRLGTGIEIQVKRTQPNDLPVAESGMSPPIEIEQGEVTPRYVEELIRRTWGGGEYQVFIKSTDPSSTEEPRVVNLKFSGDWKPTTVAGRIFWDRMVNPNLGAATAEEHSKSFVDLLGKFQEATATERQQLRQLESDARGRGESTGVEMLKTMQPLLEKRSSGFDLMGFAALAMPIFKEMMESSRARADKQEERFLHLLKEMREGQKPPTTPAEQLATMESCLRMTEKRMESELKNRDHVTQLLITEAVEAAKRRGDTEQVTILGALAHAIEERGGDFLVKLPDLISRLAGPSPAEQLAMSASGMVPQQPAAFQPTQSPPPMASPGGPPPTPSANGEATPPPREENEAAPAGAPPPMAPNIPDPIEEGKVVAARSCAAFLYYLTRAAAEKTEVTEVWESHIDGLPEGNDLFHFFAVAPAAVRGRIQKTNPEKDIDVIAWVAGVEDENVKSFSRRLADYIAADAGAKEWLRHVLAEAPWTDDAKRDEED